MSDSGLRPGPTEVPAWVIRGNELIERTYLMVRVSVMWAMFTLLGLVVVGIAPASCAAADVLIESRTNHSIRVLPIMWRSFRRQLVRANARMLPLLAVQAGSLMTLWIATVGLAGSSVMTVLLGAVAAVSGGWATASLSTIAVSPRLRRQDLVVTWKLAILLPGALPLRSLGLLLGLMIWVLACYIVWPLTIVLGAGVAIEIAVALFTRRIGDLLEDLESPGSPRA